MQLIFCSIILIPIPSLSVFFPLGSPILPVAPPIYKTIYLFNLLLNKRICPCIPELWVRDQHVDNAGAQLSPVSFPRANYLQLGQTPHRKFEMCPINYLSDFCKIMFMTISVTNYYYIFH